MNHLDCLAELKTIRRNLEENEKLATATENQIVDVQRRISNLSMRLRELSRTRRSDRTDADVLRRTAPLQDTLDSLNARLTALQKNLTALEAETNRLVVEARLVETECVVLQNIEQTPSDQHSPFSAPANVRDR